MFKSLGLLVSLILLCPGTVPAQLTTTMKPRTLSEFDAYAKRVEGELDQRWHGGKSFLKLEENPDELKKVLAGEVLVVPGNEASPIDVDGGLIHDWEGDVFIPHVTAADVIAVLRDFDRHHDYYPDIIKSHLVRGDAANVTGFWRLSKSSGILGAVLDVLDEAEYRQVAPNKWTVRSHARDIREVRNAGETNESKLDAGHDQGFLWRLYGYWSVEGRDGGAVAECRTLSLSRDVPLGFGFAVKPFIRSVPRDSMTTSLQGTKKALTH
jgi:hypothetical protein